MLCEQHEGEQHHFRARPVLRGLHGAGLPVLDDVDVLEGRVHAVAPRGLRTRGVALQPLQVTELVQRVHHLVVDLALAEHVHRLAVGRGERHRGQPQRSLAQRPLRLRHAAVAEAQGQRLTISQQLPQHDAALAQLLDLCRDALDGPRRGRFEAAEEPVKGGVEVGLSLQHRAVVLLARDPQLLWLAGLAREGQLAHDLLRDGLLGDLKLLLRRGQVALRVGERAARQLDHLTLGTHGDRQEGRGER
mmetsp:Transcript_98284/g.278233  ORF Transcript_98284/g.278233 Transcript_98284/m.278233 type:complete len:247 (+) Transcript_98284:3821-4561(+)